MKILYMEPILVHSFISILAFIIIVSLCCIALGFFCVGEYIENKTYLKIGLLALFSAVVMLIILIALDSNDKVTIETGRYRYKVIFEENYPLEKIYNDYNIVKYEDGIWVIEDKEIKNEDDAGDSN